MDKRRLSHTISRICVLITAISFCFMAEGSSFTSHQLNRHSTLPDGEKISVPEKAQIENWRTDTIYIGNRYVILQLPDETVTYINEPIQDAHCPIMIMFRDDSIIDYNSNIFFLNCLCGEPSGGGGNAEKVFGNESMQIYRTTTTEHLYHYIAIPQNSPFQIITSDLSADKARLAENILQRVTILENQPYRIDNHYPRFKIRQPENM